MRISRFSFLARNASNIAYSDSTKCSPLFSHQNQANHHYEDAPLRHQHRSRPTRSQSYLGNPPTRFLIDTHLDPPTAPSSKILSTTLSLTKQPPRLPPEQPLSKKNNPSPNSPLIVCIPEPGVLTGDGDGDSMVKDLYDSCKTGAAASYRHQTNWIFLCPLFFQVVQQATRPSAFCPAIINNRFEENGQEGKLVQNQLWNLMHEIVRPSRLRGPLMKSTISIQRLVLRLRMRLVVLRAMFGIQHASLFSPFK